MFCTCAHRRDGFTTRADGLALHSACKKPTEAHYRSVLAHRTPPPLHLGIPGAKPVPTTPSTTPTTKEIPVTTRPTRSPHQVSFSDLTDASIGSMVRERIVAEMAAAAPAKRQAAVLAKQREAEVARERLSQEQAQRRTAGVLSGYRLPGGSTMPSLDLREVVVQEVAPTAMVRRYAVAADLLGVQAPVEGALWAHLGGLHTELGLLAPAAVRAEIEAQRQAEAAVQTVVETKPKKAKKAKKAKAPVTTETSEISEISEISEQAGEEPPVMFVLADLKPKKRAKAQALIDALGYDEERAVATVLSI